MLHALQQGVNKIEICTVDTDVIIILMGAFPKLVKTQPVADIWVAFGMGKSYRFLSINAIFDSLGKQKVQALPLFHALSGSDTTSAFKGKGKKSAWQAWQAFAEVTDTFVYLSMHPFESLSVDSIHFKAIKRFVVLLYDRTSPLISVNDTREELFCKRNRSIENQLRMLYFSIPNEQCIKQEFGRVHRHSKSFLHLKTFPGQECQIHECQFG